MSPVVSLGTASAERALVDSPSIGLPVDVSTEGWRIDFILQVTHILMLILAVVALLWLGVSLVRDRSSKTASYTHGRSRRAIAVPLSLAALVFLGIDGYLLARSTYDLRTLGAVEPALAQKDVVRVQIGARQWAWDVRSPGQDGSFDTADDIFTVGELVVPVGQPVVYQLSSGDVVHALYIPNLRIKQDAVPGRIHRGWFQVTEPGRFEIACAQHCGVHHYKMRAVVHALPPAQYSAWVASGSADARAMIAEDQRAQLEEPTRSDTDDFLPERAPARNWTWAWDDEELSPSRASEEDSAR